MLVSDFVYISCLNTQEVVKKTFWSYTGVKWHSCSLDAKEYKLWATSWHHPVQLLSRMLATNHVFPQTSDLKTFGLLCVFALIPHLPLLPWFPFKPSTIAHSPCISSLAFAAWPPSRTPSLFPPAAPISLSAVCITSLLCSLQQNPLLWPGAAHMAVLVPSEPSVLEDHSLRHRQRCVWYRHNEPESNTRSIAKPGWSKFATNQGR